jgi:hypothetical protein
MHEDELEMLEPDEPTPGSRRFRIAKVLAASAAVATLGIVGATVARADSPAAAGTTSQVGQSSVDTQDASQSSSAGDDCPFHSNSGTSAAVGARG